ncbi:hypothetical protein QR680_014139 [Steinernema hermaphroditum]|uniref:EGF-like domain-containing protein n=1 Tax=Steinernema hermaphroditum TaxID=289476 RepID=A0AA39IA43_9BILA|nr:hypothetical protein QR680_014139 [Steinernema hermaphroditum]
MMTRAVFVAVALVALLALVSARATNRTVRCEYGQVLNGKCKCRDGYVGQYCELKMHCEGFSRTTEGHCVSCRTGWTSSYCELVDCGANGVRDHLNATTCHCTPPYSGYFCTEQTTKNVYLHYNKMMYSLGPVGVIIVLPLMIFIACCKRDSSKRQKRRIEEAIAHNRKTTILMSASSSSRASSGSEVDLLVK